MKKLKTLLLISFLLLSFAILFSNCKKDTDDPVVPVFDVTSTTVMLQSGGDGLQFDAKCTNTDVKMTEVRIIDPGQSPYISYNLNGTDFNKNEIFGLQATEEAYYKEAGTWSFTFIGNLISDGTSFSIPTTLTIQ
ncbi:MAG: hypothetical protein HGA23_00480 [Bacteroidales bacterium]|nr:hypothetical protein [Bacteroidales bacterium]